MSCCRLCGAATGHGPRLTLADAPSGAQAFTASPDTARRNRTTLEIVQCLACGLVQSASAAVPTFRSAITAAGVSEPMRRHRARQTTRLARDTPGPRTALVGCGVGYELTILAAGGLEPEGVEWGGAPPGYAGPWPVHDGYPERGRPMPGAPYAAFACFNFLEHAPDPAGFLDGIARSLGAGARGIVEVPNYDQMIRDRRAYDYIADHLSYFAADTLRTALELGGFDVAEVEEVRGGESLVAWVRRDGTGDAAGTMTREAFVTPAPLAEHAAALAVTRQSLSDHLAAARTRGARTAVWGASHQALTLLGGADPGLVTAIIDKSPAKQGKFAPASGIEIVAPSEHAVAGVESVVILASGYEREIAAELAALKFGGRAYVIRNARVVVLD